MKRIAVGALALLAVLLAAVALAANPVLRSGEVRTRLAAAVLRATGYRTNLATGADLSLSGLWTLRPVLEARNLQVESPPGYSRPALATVAHASARLALLPLLAGRTDVSDVLLDGADVLLERGADGHGNWEPLPPMHQPDPAPAGAPSPRRSNRIGSVTVRNSVVRVKDGPALDVTQLVLAPSGGPISFRGALNQVPLTADGTMGANAAPLELSLAGAGLTATLHREAGGALAVDGQAKDLAALSPLLGRPLPPLQDVTFAGQYGPGQRAALHATAGASDLGHGLHLAHATLSAPAPDQPIQLTADGAWNALPIAVTVTSPRFSALFASGPVPFQAHVDSNGGQVDATGTAARDGTAEATVSARIPDLRHAGSLAGIALPPLTILALDARLAPAPNGSGLLVRGLRATAAQGDIGGDLLVRWIPRPLLRGSLVSQRLDLDGLLAPAPTQPPAAPSPATTPQPPPAAAPPRPLPFGALRTADADLRLSAGSTTWHGGEYRALQARILLQDGQLRLDPAQVQTPGGTVDARLAADAAATPPTLALALLAPGLDAAPLAAAFGMPGAVTGTLDLDLDLRGAGTDWLAMVPTLDGHAGVALVNGDVENHLLLALFGGALRAANLPADAAGRSKVRCFALRFDAVAGHVDVKTLALDASRARLDGEGTLNLVDSTLNLHLRPTLRIGGTALAVPVHLLGPIRAPVPTLERGAIAPGRIGLSILGAATPQPDLCAPALAAARGNRPGAAPQ